MKLFKTTTLVLAVVTTLFVTNTAQAAILSFDDFTTEPKTTLTNYGGFQWTQTGVLDTSVYEHQISGYVNGVTSGNYVAFNTYANLASASQSLFNFVGANFTAAWNDDLQLTVEGFLNGILTNSKTVTLQPVGTEAASRIDFNFNGIDELRFNSFGGTLNPTVGGAGCHFAMDDFEYTPVPEPTTALLGLMGIGSLLGRIRRKK